MSLVPADIYELLTLLLGLGQEWSRVQFSNEDIDSAFPYSLDIVSKEKRTNVVAAKVMFIHAGQLDRAQQEIADARSRGYSFDSDLSTVEQRVDEEVVSRR